MGSDVMQCKDIPDEPILRLLQNAHDKGLLPATYWDLEPKTRESIPQLPTVADAMPAGIDNRLRRAKMIMLVRRGLVDGCTCGCRGDFIITARGIAWLHRFDSYHATEDDDADDLGQPANL